MSNQLEHMKMMHSICERELQQLQKNCEIFIKASSSTLQFLSFSLASGKEAGSFEALLAFDQFMSKVSSVVNLARKINIHLQLNSLDQVFDGPSYANTIDEDKSKEKDMKEMLIKEFINKYQTDMKVLNCTNEYKHNVMLQLGRHHSDGSGAQANKTGIMRKVNFDMRSQAAVGPLCNLSEYTEGYEFRATITYVESYKQHLFYALEKYSDELHALGTMQNLLCVMKTEPRANEIFGIYLNNKSIVRAMLEPGRRCFARLCDFGDIILLDENCKLYVLPPVYETMPMLSIKCILVDANEGENDFRDEQSHLTWVLERNEFRRVRLRVVQNLSRVLYVQLYETNQATKWKSLMQDQKFESMSLVNPSNKLSNPFAEMNIVESKFNIKKEPQNETDHSDYDSTIKLNTLKNEPFIKYENQKDAKFNSNDIGNDIASVTVTHIDGVITFYAHIVENTENTPLYDFNSFSWRHNELLSKHKLQEPPNINDIILAQYHKDEFWYRAKILKFDKVTKLFEVFYVDFGNTENVPLGCLAHCPYKKKFMPFCATRCRLADIYEVTGNDENLNKQAVESLVVSILHQNFTVKILQRTEKELLVRIIDEEFAEVPKILVKMGYAKFM